MKPTVFLLALLATSLTGCASARCASGPVLVSERPVRVDERVEILTRVEVQAPTRVEVFTQPWTGTIVALGDPVRIRLADFPDTVSISRADVLAVHRSIGMRGPGHGLKWFAITTLGGVALGAVVGSVADESEKFGRGALIGLGAVGFGVLSLPVGALVFFPATFIEGWECAPLPPVATPAPAARSP